MLCALINVTKVIETLCLRIRQAGRTPAHPNTLKRTLTVSVSVGRPRACCVMGRLVRLENVGPAHLRKASYACG